MAGTLLLLLLLPPLLPASMLHHSGDNMAMEVKNMPLKVGHTLTVTGVPNAGADRFGLNILSGTDNAFHMSVWWKATSVGHNVDEMVIYNTYQGGVWEEEIHQGGFPFKQKELFKFTVTLTHEEFLVILSDGSEVHFPNRLGACEYLDFTLWGGVLIRSFEIN
ncbi:beta-galactoside-binding lectin-like [Gadus morhua]|uniref:beta-galactoside-binding lectin-like n=1 Tax=Gadus morhua TaxID=8049 RepID=UPI0011B48C0F|nr:beta-galactoside-binding lectin-like [Gadus morhua]